MIACLEPRTVLLNVAQNKDERESGSSFQGCNTCSGFEVTCALEIQLCVRSKHTVYNAINP